MATQDMTQVLIGLVEMVFGDNVKVVESVKDSHVTFHFLKGSDFAMFFNALSKRAEYTKMKLSTTTTDEGGVMATVGRKVA